MKGFFDRMKEGAAEAAKYAQQTVEVTRLRAQISSKEKEIDRYFGAIGERVFQAYMDGNLAESEPFIGEASAQILRLRQEIVDVENRIQEVRQTKPCVCGREVPADKKFCPDCGHRFEGGVKPEEVVVEPEETPAEACPACGAQRPVGIDTCPACGRPGEKPDSLPPGNPE
ncbi:hypothetical protein J31TS4_21110 [Paenibacillus sp. J31TS4]|uniref:double zinc ribbon domain-containing protein n=1 Tax=Paenibacillus sp. J31TS4 TaxID=2807195 RepID=UPI001B1A67AD|nr:zinc ribbon domain-containing protein [Paenibacillus sp. J31TS4]GIP38831.1 hypothetical protein J31TS4_21110 [Paenibacillus sp. J31TS4]